LEEKKESGTKVQVSLPRGAQVERLLPLPSDRDLEKKMV